MMGRKIKKRLAGILLGIFTTFSSCYAPPINTEKRISYEKKITDEIKVIKRIPLREEITEVYMPSFDLYPKEAKIISYKTVLDFKVSTALLTLKKITKLQLIDEEGNIIDEEIIKEEKLQKKAFRPQGFVNKKEKVIFPGMEFEFSSKAWGIEKKLITDSKEEVKIFPNPTSYVDIDDFKKLPEIQFIASECDIERVFKKLPECPLDITIKYPSAYCRIIWENEPIECIFYNTEDGKIIWKFNLQTRCIGKNKEYLKEAISEVCF